MARCRSLTHARQQRCEWEGHRLLQLRPLHILLLLLHPLLLMSLILTHGRCGRAGGRGKGRAVRGRDHTPALEGV